MRSQATPLGAHAAGRDEADRTHPITPISLQDTGSVRERTARIASAASRRGADGIDGASARSASDRGPVAAADRVVAGRYRLSTLLGTGGMGEVWLAEDAVLRRAVALKTLTSHEPEVRRGLLQEARAGACVAHPGVVRVHDVIFEEDADWIVMEALPGEPLSATIRERGPLPVDEVAQLALQLLSALQAIHVAGLVHRDIKPSNVQLCGAGRVVITDFGLSSPRGVEGGLRDGTVAGSLSYMAPETLIEGIFGPASDLYALGVTLYTAVEGHPPFDPVEPMLLVDSVLSVEPRPAPHAGPLSEVLDGLLVKEPERRMTAAHARECLEALALVAA
jgi:serine/threonine protein kinase